MPENGELPIPLPPWFNPTYFIQGLSTLGGALITVLLVMLILQIAPWLVLIIFNIIKLGR